MERDTRIAVLCDDPAVVAASLGKLLEVSFEARESSYGGDYWTAPLSYSIRVLSNLDPMYLPDSDPPGDQYFEADYSTFNVLVDVASDEQIGRRVVEFLSNKFPGSATVFGPSS